MAQSVEMSVVIPTFGLGRHLAAVLKGLALQTRCNFEIVIVDNNRRPRWLELRRAGAGDSADVAVVHEPRNGLTYARNTGISVSRGDIIAFLDDDAVPEPGWARTLVDGLVRYGAAAAGGTVNLDLPGPAPDWLGASERALLSELRYSGKDIPTIDRDMYIVGANISFLREALEQVGRFDSRFGRTARTLRSSEEVEMTRRLQERGFGVSFVAAARVRHQIDSYRLTERYLVQRAYWQGRSDAMLEARWGRPASFGVRTTKTNLMELSRHLLACVREKSRAELIRKRIAFAREGGYCLQRSLLWGGRTRERAQGRVGTT